MNESEEEKGRDLSRLVVSRAGRLVTTGDAVEPYRVVGPDGEVVEPVAVFLRDLLASGKSKSTLRSYSVDLLRWWRFLGAVGVGWDRASRVEARDFSCWIQLTAKQRLQTSRPKAARLPSRAAGAPNPVTGKPAAGDGYATSTVVHSETVLRRFYDFHRDGGTGPVLNPFPLDSSRRGRRHAHHNPLDEWAPERSGRYRPALPKRFPRAIPDEWFNRLFASLGSELLRVFRTGILRLIHAATCLFRNSSMTSCGVRYPIPEWRRVRLYRSSIHRAISFRACWSVGYCFR
ncbi:MAG TPA: site-specific integrase [Amycolatopsis sp.]|nr:site-specific integrase [Amycolatopsis sp.]